MEDKVILNCNICCGTFDCTDKTDSEKHEHILTNEETGCLTQMVG